MMTHVMSKAIISRSARPKPTVVLVKYNIIQSPLRMKLAPNRYPKSPKIRESFLDGTMSPGRTEYTTKAPTHK